MTIINKVNQASDLKKLSINELEKLAEEIRGLLLKKVSQTGGHVGPNLGVVELTLAFHYVFDSPMDKILWDVSHQSYSHKIVTGRKEAWLDETSYKSVTGYTAPEESPHDFFTVGHTSTSVSLAVGMAKARDIQGESGNIVAVLGDGSLSGGLALEGLSNAAELDSNLIVVLNDNEMSIAENHGGIYRNLAELRKNNGQAATNLFTAMGLNYQYVEEGNNVAEMITAFEMVKNSNKPIVLHVHTEKGHGYTPAVTNKERFHWQMPFDLETGDSKSPGSGESYDSVIIDVLTKKIEEQQPIVAITAAIPGLFGLKELQKQHPDHYIDVGIAEQHSITYAAGLAKAGAKPVIFHSSTFLQRAYDQLSHDLAINDLPAVIIVKGGKISGGDPTHQGSFDIPYITSIPNIIYLAPTSKEEVREMLNWALEQNEHPVAIRIPERGFVSAPLAEGTFHPLEWAIEKQGEKVAILATGGFLGLGEETAKKLQEHHVDATLINPRSFTYFDSELLKQLQEKHQVVVTLEDGSLDGGYGEKISRYYGSSDMKVLNFGAQKRFNHHQTMEELYEEFHLLPELIAEDILAVL
ncbi:1-deoxy-D-xylulose-5-phosphate synthase [Candidatus Enterococcus clewellii]|uniref:1-deoxy-D-xylulose-5-phosphate synthase n=1 Tax=Candidatus Enterococcus clewellii TaxID=1834193 RepID=A0A242KB95_9ENTE|nr:1-deoxy-D-xylulose-5-phosphate synthase [Enterococcus sp. 9E7_DIV0242]OTP18444.1 1-deoxy-D-xylulose-5-phosphate synthase [Enterococcus sp. 9E7_DIV0242]